MYAGLKKKKENLISTLQVDGLMRADGSYFALSNAKSRRVLKNLWGYTGGSSASACQQLHNSIVSYIFQTDHVSTNNCCYFSLGESAQWMESSQVQYLLLSAAPSGPVTLIINHHNKLLLIFIWTQRQIKRETYLPTTHVNKCIDT